MRLLEWRLMAGELRQVPEVRALMRRALPARCLRGEDVETVSSELAANAVLHTASGRPGGKFGVALYQRGPRGGVEVRVHDEGGPTVPRAIAFSLDPANLDGAGSVEAAVSGRGLMLVATLADLWGYVDVAPGRYVWAAFDVPGVGLAADAAAATATTRTVTTSTTVASALCGSMWRRRRGSR